MLEATVQASLETSSRAKKLIVEQAYEDYCKPASLHFGQPNSKSHTDLRGLLLKKPMVGESRHVVVPKSLVREYVTKLIILQLTNIQDNVACTKCFNITSDKHTWIMTCLLRFPMQKTRERKSTPSQDTPSIISSVQFSWLYDHECTRTTFKNTKRNPIPLRNNELLLEANSRNSNFEIVLSAHGKHLPWPLDRFSWYLFFLSKGHWIQVFE